MAEDSGAAPSKKGKGKTIVLLAAGMLLVAGLAGAAAWHFASAGANGDATHADAKGHRKAAHRSVFVPLDQFVVNLSDLDSDRYAQVAAVLELDDASGENTLKTRMPAVRNAILLLLTARSAAELLSLEGKEQLAIDIALAVHAILADEAPPRPVSRAARSEDGAARPARTFDDVETGPVVGVHFSNFIVQ